MKVVVVGAGGLGSYVGAVLGQAGHDVKLVARGAHRAAIEREGLRVLSHAGNFTTQPTCVTSALDVDAADLALVVTKTYSLDEVAPQLLHLATTGADIVSLLNGVSARDRLIARGVPAAQVGDGVAYMTSFRVEPGVVERRAEHQRIVVAEQADHRPSRTTEEAFSGTIVGVEGVPDVDVELWEKLAVVSPLAVLCAIGEGTMGSVRAHPHAAHLQRAAIEEVLDVGRAAGVPIPAGSDEEIDERLDRFPDTFFPSVIHDLNQERRTEMDDLGGEVVRLGRELGVPTPVHEVGTLRIELAERRYR